MSNQPNKTNGAKPAVRKKKNLLDDRRVRLALSVLGAIVAWMVVTIIVQPGTTNTIYNVPVDYTYDSAAYTSRGLSIVSAEDKTVTFTIHTDGTTLRQALEENSLIAGDESDYGLYVKTVDGMTADYDADGLYWAFYKSGEYLMTGVDTTEIADGEQYELVCTAA